MTKPTELPPRAAKRVERHTQILDAALICVRETGIHAATLNRIAARAGMSGGHVYHFFATKEAIMIALCDRDADDFIMQMTDLATRVRDNPDWTIEALAREIMALFSSDRAALTMDFIAEAGRNERFLEIVLRNDEHIRQAIRCIVEPLLTQLAPEELSRRVESLLVTTRGLICHAATRPASDYHLLTDAFEVALRGVLGERAG